MGQSSSKKPATGRQLSKPRRKTARKASPKAKLILERVPRSRAARALLELFFPVHYSSGMKVEDTLRSSSALDRQQAIILWLVRSEGEGGTVMRRKYIQATMTSWYDITGSSISRAIRAMAKAPLGLISIEEHPKSAREKLIRLTRKGQRFIKQMEENGTALTAWFLGEFSAREADVCLYSYARVNAVFDHFVLSNGGADSQAMAADRGYRTEHTTYQQLFTPEFVLQQNSLSEIPNVPTDKGPIIQLDQFFPIHYKVGNRIEDVLRSGIELSRQQVVILWIIHAEGENGQSMPRKEIEQHLQDWFEITSSAVSKAIRSLTRNPFNLLVVSENPSSGREKIVSLNRKGRLFVELMLENGTQFLRGVIEQLGDDEIDMLLHTFRKTGEVFETYPGPFRSARPVLPPAD